MIRGKNQLKTHAKLRSNIQSWLIMLPGLALMAFFVWEPLLESIRMSLYKTQNVELVRFVGLDNFISVIGKDDFIQALVNTFLYTFWSLLLGFVLPIILAMFIGETTRGKGFFRTAVYLPNMLPGLAVIILYDPSAFAADGNRFLCANGYMGVRGSVEEADKTQFPAITLADVYDQYQDKWREPVNAPNCLFVQLSMNAQALRLNDFNGSKHCVQIDYLHGVYQRETDFGAVTLRSRRFASMDRCHLLSDRLLIEAKEDGELEILTGVFCDLWDINGPHLFDQSFEQGKVIVCRAVTGE